jgi:dienelactone hydrolase
MLTRLAFVPLFFLLAGACIGATSSVSITATALNGALEEIPATLVKPNGPGPFPAIVIMHDCSGLGPSSSGAPGRWAKELSEQGYVVLMPDSFTTRGYRNGVCTDPSPKRAEVGPYRRVSDAYAALVYLRIQPYVDGQRVGLMGGSHGGTTTLATMITPDSDTELIMNSNHMGFVAAVALYPGCAAILESWRVGPAGVYRPLAPVLILIGEKDDWTPAAPCRKLTETAQGAGYPVAIKVYPDAYHSFDSSNPVRYVGTRVNANSPSGRGATTGGNPNAWAESIREVVAFFGKHVMQAGK